MERERSDGEVWNGERAIGRGDGGEGFAAALAVDECDGRAGGQCTARAFELNAAT